MNARAQLEVMATGAQATLQDGGRRGWRRIGVPWAGVLDPRLMRIANALVGNAAGTPVIEAFDAGAQFAARSGGLRLAVAGHAQLELLQADGERRAMAAWRSLYMADGDMLRVRQLAQGRFCVIAVEGLAVATMLGSASTYARAALGGVQGRALATGMRLDVRAAALRREWMLADPPAPDASAIRVVPGPQADHFTPEALAALVAADYRVTTDADRMGLRLEGERLTHRSAREIVSDATVPGSIQVPGNGQPIVLLADAQTAGGYAKIGTVIGADLARLAAYRPGQGVRFAWVDAAEGERLARAAEQQTQAWLAALRPLLEGGIDLEALYGGNLLSGFVHALAPLGEGEAVSPTRT